MIRHRAIFPLAITLLASSALGAPKQSKAGAHQPAPALKGPAQRPQPNRSGPEGRGANRGVDPHPGHRALKRVEEMTPEQREKWLSTLPPARREKIERELQMVAKMPPDAQTRVHGELERLNNLPPQRQGQVRRSLQLFNKMRPERKAIVSEELKRLSAMPAEERQSRINSEDFRRRYSPMEQQMMSHLSEILPP